MPVQPGDILLFRVGPGAPWVARFIGWGERLLKRAGSSKTNYYHVGFVGPGALNYYESRPPVIRNSVVPVPLTEDIEVYRIKTPLTDDQLHKIYNYANSQIGKWYNLIGVLTGGYIQIGSVSFCSQFTWQAYTYAGIVLCPWETLESPDDIAASDLLERILPPE